MGTSSLRSLLLAAIVLSNCITWTASRHHYTHNVNGHRSRHRRQGAGLFLPASYVIPGGEGSGAWGEWGEISPCSRTCGGGVASQKRICLEFGSDGRPRCTGGDTKYFSCQTHDCPEGAGDFRAEQCAEFNDKMFRDQKIYSWVPYTKGRNPCELNCMPRGERFYYRQREAVVDGTRCNDESFDVCVNGTCQAVGCDMMLGSNAREDKCRECRGNGTNCKTMEGIIPFDPEVKRGYVDVLLIPQGATNIIIEEIKASNNYLALRAKERTRYYLNGDYHIDFPRSLVIAGALWHYERNQMGFAAPDRLRCVGPINEPLYLSLLLQEDNVGVKYEYSIPSDLAPRPAMKYDWMFEKFTPCSATCGGGFQMRAVTCRSRDDLEQVDESLCDGDLKPATNQTCNTQACPPHWVEGPWSPCSKPCGEGGIRSRQIQCEKIVTNGLTFRFPSIVSDKECVELLGAKPNLYEECNKNATCPTWFTGPWKPCDKLCGQGVQTRQVVCHTRLNGRVEVFDDNECSDEKPPAEQPCNLHPCTGIDYVLSDWAGCDTCLSTKRTRLAKCVTKDNVVVEYSMCAYHPEPVLEEQCDKSQLPQCEVQWYATQWSNCSVECGVGIKTRRVFCGMVNGDAIEEVEDSRCDPDQKYQDTKPCEVPKENCPAKWFTGPWSKCTKKCGGGEQYRHVTCLIGDKVVLSCSKTDIPDTLQTCNMKPCNEDEVIPVDSSSTPIMDDDVYYDYQDCDEDYKEEVGAEEEEVKAGENVNFDATPFPKEDFLSNGSKTELESGMTDLSTDYFTTDDSSGFGSTFESTSTETTDSSTVSSSEVTDSKTGVSTTVSSGSDNTESAVVDVNYSTEPESTETDSTETSNTETVTTESSNIETGSTETSNSETGSTESSNMETDSTETSNAETGSTETANTETDSTEQTDSETGSTETSHTESDSTETSNMETGSTESSNTETDSTESSNTVTDSTETIITETGSTETTETGSTETSNTETGSTETTETGSTETSNTETASTETTNTETGSTETTETGSTETSNTETASTETTNTETGSTESVNTETSNTESSTTESTETGSTESTESSSTTAETATESTSTMDNISTTFDSDSTDETTKATTQNKPIQNQTILYKTTKHISTTESSTTDVGSTQTTEETSSSTTEEVSGSTLYSTTEGISESSTTESVTTESEVSASSETEDTSSTEFSSTGTTESTSESSEASTASETVSEVSTTSSTDITESTEFSSTASDEDTESTPTGVTESTIDLSSTTSSEQIGLTTGYSTKTDWGTTMKELTGPRRCVPKKVAKCLRSLYGCCPDKKTPAKGPFEEGCPNPKTCETTKFKCCSDGVSPAAGPNNKGCPVINCNETLYGCCLSDNTTPAEGNDQEGCPKPVPACEKSKYGCCADGQTKAKGLEKQGCPETQTDIPETTTQSAGTTTIATTKADNETEPTGPDGSGLEVLCNITEFGCCPDGVSPAAGARMEGCVMSCNTSLYGCCPDGQTPAHGSDYEGCCLQTAFGCCPDNYKPADGPHLEGCGCQYTRYGCCPDNMTIARGPNKEGCGCQYTQFGCCPDSHTEAQGPEYSGCDCSTYQFGCCPDGFTAAVGPNLQGCHCQQTDYGCCGDGQTAAKGPSQLGCDCSNSKYGCCPDGVTEAQGEKFLGCTDVPENRQAACSLPNDRGTCRNFTVNWYYDTVYGGCSRFWYGGCDGNGNRFNSQDECEDVCVQPSPKDACKLPSVRGSCSNPTIRWYYDSIREQCLQFEYGGCLGNANNFGTSELCQKQCEPARSEDQCNLPIERGSCAGNFPRWGYNAEQGRCEQFTWGGCEGNHNRFSSEAACLHRCSPPGQPKPECSLPQESGNCTDKLAVWAFRAPENRCLPFYYTGCGGNDNRFESEDECARVCPSAYEKDTCVLPAVTGNCANYTLRWFFDTKDKRCRQFYYGGCDGNDNNFHTEEQCESRCLPRATTPAPAPSPQTFENSFCFLELDPGPCNQFATRWAYDAARGGCVPFEYGGCGGNTNNFDTHETCEAYCSQIQDVCQLPQVAGPCQDWSAQWFYDATVDACRQFYYGGCDGNGNRFATQQTCEQRCQRQEPATRPTIRPATRPASTTTTTTTAVTTTTTPRAPSSTGTDPCKQPRESGNCVGYIVKWYYDEVRDACGQFVYTGCDGNDNRFESQADCEDRCILRITPATVVTPQTPPATTPAVTTTTYRPPVQEREECRTPVSLEPCGENITTYYYDSQTGACLSGYFGACDYANSYRSEEECERQCGAFRNIDVCRATLDPGTCFYSVDKVYWDAVSGRCLPFTYSGCLGGPNRFSSVEECEDVCGRTGPEPACLHPVDTGRRCGVSAMRWWYEVSVADCRAFIYLGCDGNDNNFLSYDECAARCRPDFIDNEVVPNCDRFEEYCEQLRCEGQVVRSTGPDGCVRCACAATTPAAPPSPAPVDCEPARRACASLTCAIIERTIGADGCEVCQCTNPCANTVCQDGERCVFEPYASPLTSEVTYLAECRPMNKSGWCPRMAANGTSCERQCSDDADCRGVGKCCARGCQYYCVSPLPTTLPAPVPTTTYTPELPRAPVAAPETQQTPEVSAAEGGTATLRCLFHGNPPPSITWRRGEITIESDRERYRLRSDGALEIVSIYRSDAGVYICIGANQLGSASKEVRLVVNDPVEGPAGIAGAARAVARGRLGQPLHVRCLAYGYPVPSIYWYRGREGPMVPYSNELYEARGNILQIRSLIPEALGEYICQAYNGIGKAAEWSVMVQLEEENAPPSTTETTTEATTTTTSTPQLNYRFSGYTVPVSTRILTDRTTVDAGSEVNIRCDVNGYPLPDVYWTKDSVRISPTDRITPTEARLTISNANINDSGEYGCHASNAYSSHSALVRITVQGVYIPAKCSDNPYFANCALIVRSKFCNHPYYSRFCCKSCVEAGQLDPQDASIQADQPWRKK